MADLNTPRVQHFLDITFAQGKLVVQPKGGLKDGHCLTNAASSSAT